MESIYDYRKQIGNVLKIIEKESRVCEENKKLMFAFKDDCLANNICLARIIKCLYILKNISFWLNKGFISYKTEDIKQLLAKLEIIDNLSPRTKVDYRGVVKKFFKWLSLEYDLGIDTSWIKTSFKKHNDKLPSELLTEEDIITMINTTKNSRDMAIISSLYESGCRIGEFLKIQIKDIIFEKHGCIFMVNGKTGGRRVRLISSEPHIIEWINKHPDKNNLQSFLWSSGNTSDMIGYPAFCKVLRVASRRAGIKKKVNPHNFRHARATYLASKFTEQQLKVFFGWTRASDMASVYVHLSGKEVDNALLEIYGISEENKESKISKLKPSICFMCKTQNEITNKFCKVCGTILDKEMISKSQAKETENGEVNQIMNILFKDKDVLTLVAQKIKEVKL